MLFRERPDAVFPSNKKKGKEKSHRRWIILNYGGDPDNTSEKEFQNMISNWEGYEAAGLEFLFIDWIMSEKEKQQKS